MKNKTWQWWTQNPDYPGVNDENLVGVEEHNGTVVLFAVCEGYGGSVQLSGEPTGYKEPDKNHSVCCFSQGDLEDLAQELLEGVTVLPGTFKNRS